MTDLIETVARVMYPNGNDNDGGPDAYEMLRAIEAAGYRIVPVEPTLKMSDDGKSYMKGSEGELTERTRAEGCYLVMLAAAPKVVP